LNRVGIGTTLRACWKDH